MKLTSALASALVVAGFLAALALPPAGFAAPARWEAVPAVDWSKVKLEDFRDDELDLPYFLHHFHTVANAVQEDGPTRGFMTIPVWRGRDKNQQAPHNARVMESHLTLAFFYCTDRPWNPYLGSPAVRERLEAMLTFWCQMQHEDGRFSEYKPQGWNLPATAFATKFMGQTLTLLLGKSGETPVSELHAKTRIPPIDAALLKRVIEAERKAILAVLTQDALYEHGKRFTNQYTNVYAGAATYLALFPDDKEIPPLLARKFADGDRDFHSPCGYFYEADGPDFGYTLYTHHSNARMTYHYARGNPIGDTLEAQEKAWNQWLGYNLLREPDGSFFVFNRAIQTRQNQAHWERQDGPFAERVEAARPFATTREERDAQLKQKRAELAASWGKFPDLPIGKPGYPLSPYNFLHRDHKTYYPSNAERHAAIAKLPYLASDRFVKQFEDTRKDAVFTFIRRPSYYAAFNSGPQITDQQRLGLGLIWSPKAGAVLQSQTSSDDHAWGTRDDGAEQVYEAGDVTAKFSDDLTTVNYSLGEAGRKSITFREEAIVVRVDHSGKFAEQIPLLARPDQPSALEVQAPAGTEQSNSQERMVFGKTSLRTLTLSASDSLTYTIRFRNP
jgi:hypothetical protein